MSGQSERMGLPVVQPSAAGIDIGSRFHVVAVPPEITDESVQTFQSYTSDLHRLADWLTQLDIKTVAMESTGVYWVPVFEILEDRGLDVILVNAREVRNIPGRKTDVNDAQWLSGYMLAVCYVQVFGPVAIFQPYEPTYGYVNGT